MSARWIEVGPCSDVPPREGRLVIIDGREIAVFNLGDRFTAMDNRCPHKGGPLSDGLVAGNAVVCPLHAWRINLESGVVERPCGGADAVVTYPTRVEEGTLILEVADQPRHAIADTQERAVLCP